MPTVRTTNEGEEEMRYVCCADLHLRPDKPPCRVESPEEWVDNQLRKLSFILEFAAKNHATVLVAGDVCHRATGWPSWFFSRVIDIFKAWPEASVSVYTIPGQHDLPYHQLSQLDRSNLGVLLSSGAVKECTAWGLMGLAWGEDLQLVGFAWGEDLQAEKGASIAMAHLMVLKSKKDAVYPGQVESAAMATDLLKRFPNYNLIVTGDNHQPFAAQYEGRWLVNPGSMTRQRTTETHSPGFYLYDDATNMVERIPLPHDPNAVTDAHQHQPAAAAWAGDLDAVAEMLDTVTEGEELNFRAALETYFKQRKTRAEVQKKILGE
jgi:DNA repair exonuclease SbcCD nuclease subunit